MTTTGSLSLRPTLAALLATAVLATTLLTACAGYRPAGSSPASQDRGGRTIEYTAPELLSGPGFDLRDSDCELPARTVFVIRFVVHTDGSADGLQFTQGEPSACIREHVADVVARSTFEPGQRDGEPAEVTYSRTLQTP